MHIHKPKIEYFDLTECTNTDPKGHERPVDLFHTEPWGLYMARGADHPQFHYLESWLLPELSLRATIFHFRPGYQRDQDFYLDIGAFGPVTDTCWRSIDHYLDLVVRTGRETELLDVDELLAAHANGLLDAAAAESAIHTATTALAGIAAHGYDFDRWTSQLGMPLSWKDRR